MNNTQPDTEIIEADPPEWYQMHCPECDKPVDFLVDPDAGEAEARAAAWVAHTELSPDCSPSKLNFVFGGFYSYELKGGKWVYPLKSDQDLRTGSHLNMDSIHNSQRDKFRKWHG